MSSELIPYVGIVFILLLIFVFLQQMGKRQSKRAREKRRKIMDRLSQEQEDKKNP